MRLIAPLLLLAACSAEVPQPTPLPGGFVDATGQIGIFNTPGGGVQTVELAAGKSFFRTNQAQRPLFLAGDRLYALAAVKAPVIRGLCFEWQPAWEGPRDGFRLVAFDLAQFGEMVLESETVPLPEWASIVDAHDHSFAFRWHMENGRLVVAWEAKSWYAGSTQKTPQEEAAFRKQAAGAVRFDLESAAFELLPPQPAPPGPPSFEASRELERYAIRWQKWTPKQHLVLTLEETPGKQTLSLRTFDAATRQPLGVKALKSGSRLMVLPTIDELYLCLREAVPSPSLTRNDEDQTVLWLIVTADGGQHVAEVPYEPGTTAAAILGGRVYFLIGGGINGRLDQPYVIPRSLRAVDLKTGATLWEQPVGGKAAMAPPLIARPTSASNSASKKPAVGP